MDNKVVIDGEAPETDSEDELKSDIESPNRMVKSIQGAVIAGEDSESDDEHVNSVSSAVSALTHPEFKASTPDSQNDSEGGKFNSLLHKKLKERNKSLYNNIQTFKHNVINEAAKNLTSIDQQLLKSQVTLQSAITSLRSLNQHATNLKEKIDTIISSKFFNNVKSNNTDDI